MRSLLSSIVVAVYHVNDKLLCGRGKGRGVPPPPTPFGGLEEFYQIKLITSEITLFTQSIFFQGILSELVTSGKKINYAFVDFGNSNKMKRCVILE